MKKNSLSMLSRRASLLLIALYCSLDTSTAFLVTPSSNSLLMSNRSSHTNRIGGLMSASAVSAEQGEVTGSGTVNGDDLSSSPANKYASVMQSTGLLDQLKIAQSIPERSLSPNDVFCNREMRLGSIRAIGFDMDYTLIQYHEPAFGELAFNGAKDKLVNKYGYPEEVLDLAFDFSYWRRGLIIDTNRGNFLKIDRHKYVRLAYHGFQPIDSDARKTIYSKSFNKVMSFTEKSFVDMDTLFQIVDAHLFAHLVEMKDRMGDSNKVLSSKSYAEMYKDIRACIDLCHRDGVIKDEVARDPTKYIVLDRGVIDMLRRYRDAGVNTFLLTNSLWEYTSVAMNYLYHETADYDPAKKDEWLQLFDLVIVGSCKPAFLLDPYLNLFRVDTKSGMLSNTDGLFDIEALSSPEESGASAFLFKGKVFQGGNWQHLHALLEVEAGEDVLYVGDHLYSDVLRSKRTLGWRTAMIVPELEHEMKVFRQQIPLEKQVAELRSLRDELSSYGDNLRSELNLATDESKKQDILNKLEMIAHDDKRIKEMTAKMNYDYHMSFHPVWGQMFKAGYQDSRFAFYITNYSCLYTSKASNLGLSSTERGFRTSAERSPHDVLLSTLQNFIE